MRLNLEVVLVLAAAIAAFGARADEGAEALRAAGKPMPYNAAKALDRPALRYQAFPEERTSLVALPAPASGPISKARTAASGDKRTRIGTPRDVESEAGGAPQSLQWLPAPGGGFVARLALASAQARSLRIGLYAAALPPASEVRFRGSESPRVVGPVRGEEAVAITRERGVFWSPLTEGDSQLVEIWIPPGSDPAQVAVSMRSASHVDASAADLFKAGGIGAAGSCNRDVVCVAGGDEAMRRAARAVARMVYTQDGTTYLCTGTLLSDGDPASRVPYFHTAAHCIGSQAAAATLNTFWFLEANECNGAAGQYRQLSGGASLLYANPSTDVALLRLNDAAPEGAWFSGWDAAPLVPGEPVVGLHHPSGDLKKASLGEALASATGASTMAAWKVGTTEGGSSGSGLFTRAGDEYVLRGGLRGGSASCRSSGDVSNAANRDLYSRLDVDAQNLVPWLKSSARPAEDRSGLWWNPAEPGWGVSLVQGTGASAFVTVYAYDADGNSMWIAMPDAKWNAGDVLEGTLYLAHGQPLDAPYDASRLAMVPAGSGGMRFSADGSVELTLEFAGKRIVKPLRRFAV